MAKKKRKLNATEWVMYCEVESALRDVLQIKARVDNLELALKKTLRPYQDLLR